MRGLIGFILLGIVAGVCSLGVVPFFFGDEGVGFVIPGIVLLCMALQPTRAIVFALAAGIVLDSYAFYPFELHTARLFCLALLGTYLFRRWLTNRSLYTAVALAGALTILDQGVGVILYGWENGSIGRSWGWAQGGRVLLFEGFVTAIGFLIVGFFTKHLFGSFSRRGSQMPYG